MKFPAQLPLLPAVRSLLRVHSGGRRSSDYLPGHPVGLAVRGSGVVNRSSYLSTGALLRRIAAEPRSLIGDLVAGCPLKCGNLQKRFEFAALVLTIQLPGTR